MNVFSFSFSFLFIQANAILFFVKLCYSQCLISGTDILWLCCITNVGIYSLIPMFTSTANVKHLRFHSLFQNPTTNVARRIATMILQTASENIVIFKHKRLKENGKKSNIDHFRLPLSSYVTFPTASLLPKCRIDEANLLEGRKLQ